MFLSLTRVRPPVSHSASPRQASIRPEFLYDNIVRQNCQVCIKPGTQADGRDDAGPACGSPPVLFKRGAHEGPVRARDREREGGACWVQAWGEGKMRLTWAILQFCMAACMGNCLLLRTAVDAHCIAA